MTAAPTRLRAEAPPLQPAMSAAGIGAVSASWVPAEGWEALRPDWEELAAAAAEPNAFLAPGFALAARGIAPAAGLGALLVCRDGRPIGLVAGRFGLAGAVFTLWTHHYAPYGVPLVRPGEAAAVVGALLSFLASEGAAALEAPLMPDGPFATALEALAVGHPTFVLDAHRRAVLTVAPPPLSKEHRRLARRLGERGALGFASTATGHDLSEAVEAFLALEAEGWKGRRGTALAMTPATRSFFEAAVTDLAARGGAQIDMLLLDGRPIAAGLVLTAGPRAWYLKTAYDEVFARFSPGLLLSHAIGAAAITAKGVELVDSCAIPDHPMIDRIWPGRMALTTRFIAVDKGPAGWRWRAALAWRRGFIGARALAKRLLRR
ncbi:MAG: GNAT family N-acetyltransferase [Phreatobacter sp.]|uniref:GNAT family N-acetyltransferase n=1 Tax=Phreatobacter sp. TaxID=1966341 RepID=UPI0040350A3B